MNFKGPAGPGRARTQSVTRPGSESLKHGFTGPGQAKDSVTVKTRACIDSDMTVTLYSSFSVVFNFFKLSAQPGFSS